MITNAKNLTKREFEILKLIAQGFSNPIIAMKLSISTNTVKYHLKKIFYKLRAKNRIEALNRYHEIEQSTFENRS
jgi:LuxR family maltose regulon positive regulatory protein